MRVNVAFEFSEPQLRTIRAAFGRGGVATRKDCRLFLNMAMVAALKAAPEPRPKRRPKVKPELTEIKKELKCECAEDGPICPACRAKRDRILSGKPAKAWRSA